MKVISLNDANKKLEEKEYDGWKLVEEKSVPEESTSVTFSDLDGDSDIEYKVEFFLNIDTDGAANRLLSVKPNNLTTDQKGRLIVEDGLLSINNKYTILPVGIATRDNPTRISGYLKMNAAKTLPRQIIGISTIADDGDAEEDWFDSNWEYRKTIPVTGSIDGTKTNYVIEVTVPYVEGMNRDFSDIRFCDSDKTTEIYFAEYNRSIDEAVFHVKIPSLPGSPTVTNIYMYFGNPTAESISDPTNVYLFYDPCTGTYSNTWLNITGTGSYNTYLNVPCIKLESATTIIRTQTFQQGLGFKALFKIAESSVLTQIQYLQDSTPAHNERYGARVDVRGGNNDCLIEDGAAYGGLDNSLSIIWHDCELTLDQNSNHIWKVDGVNNASRTDSTYTSAGYIAFSHTNAGVGYVADIRILPYTQNPPVVGDLGDTVYNPLPKQSITQISGEWNETSTNLTSLVFLIDGGSFGGDGNFIRLSKKE